MKATGSADVVAVGDQMTAAVAVVQALRTLLCVLVEWRERQVDRDVPPSAKWLTPEPPRVACEVPPLHLAFEEEDACVFAAVPCPEGAATATVSNLNKILIEDVDADLILILSETDKSAVIATNHEATFGEGVTLYDDIGGYFMHHQDQDDDSQEVTLTTHNAVDNGFDWM